MNSYLVTEMDVNGQVQTYVTEAKSALWISKNAIVEDGWWIESISPIHPTAH